MNSGSIVAVVVVVGIALLVAVLLVVIKGRRRRSDELRKTFGGEYDRTVEGAGSRRTAERELHERKERFDALELRSISPAARERYRTDWTDVQAHFVDAPHRALGEADRLVDKLLRDRGFPSHSARKQEELLSVRHRRALSGFRSGHAIQQHVAAGSADTEQVRQAMLHFRTAFEELLDDDATSGTPGADERRPADGHRETDDRGSDERRPADEYRAPDDPRAPDDLRGPDDHRTADDHRLADESRPADEDRDHDGRRAADDPRPTDQRPSRD